MELISVFEELAYWTITASYNRASITYRGRVIENPGSGFILLVIDIRDVPVQHNMQRSCDGLDETQMWS